MVFFFRPTRKTLSFFWGGPGFCFFRALKDQKTSWLQQDLHPISWWSSDPIQGAGAYLVSKCALPWRWRVTSSQNKNTYGSPEKLTWQWKNNLCEDVSPIKYWWFSIRFLGGAGRFFPQSSEPFVANLDVTFWLVSKMKWSGQVGTGSRKQGKPLLHACHPRSSFS